jgi:TolB-like protein
LGIKVQKEVQKVRDVGSRMSISILPFEKKGIPSALSDIIFDNLINSFKELRVGDLERFNLVERTRLEEILREQKLSQTALLDPKTAVRIGKIMAADGILMGSILETKDAIEIYARLVNTETASIMVGKDVFDQSKSLPSIKTLTDVLALKFENHLPLLEGMLIKKEGKKVFIDIGTNRGLKEEMKFMVFKEGEKIVHPVTGKIMGSDTEILGEAVIESINEDFSKGSLIKEIKPGKIKVMDKVITK